MEEHKDRLIETLIRGRDSAQRLLNFLNLKVNADGSVLVKDLLREIEGSFSGSLSMLNSSDSGEISGVQPSIPHVGLASAVDRLPDIRAGKKPAPAVKERRGCYKRRRTVDSREMFSSTMEDGYAWRKYGQKEILNSKFPRCYFRCTHKHFHGCKALRQVQKLEDDKSPDNMFHITYFGHHTCPNPKLGALDNEDEVIVDFEDSKNHNLFSNSPSTITNIQIGPVNVMMKQEVHDSKPQTTDDVSDIISSGNDEHSSPSALGWNEVLRPDLGSFMRFDVEEDSCGSHGGYLNQDFLNNGSDLLLSEILLNDEFS